MTFSSIVLAAGQGKRMNSSLPKVLHQVSGVPMIIRGLNEVLKLSPDKIIVVVGFGSQLVMSQVRSHFPNYPIEFVTQTEQLGTGHAVKCALPQIPLRGRTLIMAGDTPLLSSEIIKQLMNSIDDSADKNLRGAVLTSEMDDPSGYGRIVRSDCQRVEKIVEHRDADPQQLTINEINAGVYYLDNSTLIEMVNQIGTDNQQQEYYLTDIIELSGKNSILPVICPDSEAALGINDRVNLARASELIRRAHLKHLMISGVTIIDPENTYIDDSCRIEPDTIIHPGCHLSGRVIIGSDCEIGPNCQIIDSTIENSCKVTYSVVNRVIVKPGTHIGPFAHVRPGTVLGDNCRIGNFVEIKNSHLENGVKASHLSYLGDSEIGRDVNIGAGTITCNYDGYTKSRTIIGQGAFIGSNSALVAPVNVGERSMVAAGSVITKDVLPDSLAITRASQQSKENWARKYRQRTEARLNRIKSEA